MRIFYLIILSLVSTSITLAQTAGPPEKNASYWEGTIQGGDVVPVNDFVEGKNSSNRPIRYFLAGFAEWGRQSSGKQAWEQSFNYPFFGFGVWGNTYFNTEAGPAFSTYGVFGTTIYRGEGWRIGYRFRLGLAYVPHYYDPEKYPYNIFTASFVNFFFNAGLEYQVDLGDKLDLVTSLALTHYSNGRASVPDTGNNTLGLGVGLRYFPKKKLPRYYHHNLPNYDKSASWTYKVLASTRQVESGDSLNQSSGEHYLLLGLSGYWSKKISRHASLGVGLGVTYDGTVGAPVFGKIREEKPTIGEQILIDIHAGYVVTVWKISLAIQPGFYVYKSQLAEDKPILYQRVGLRYHATKRGFAYVALRAMEFSAADFIEWGIGLKFHHKKKSDHNK
ncbi:hypothetical protein FUAX_30310 [Fulvitalea axinellae]|uniref:Acyloxyacyl hydrolase n=1 Tax=Fulvitalea axinellae TaxID=1182444 RepID=A0AAU9CVT2_9BACT|nr:hypothetical protein FUAX_30310 [Fulvitalea axinellae]